MNIAILKNKFDSLLKTLNGTTVAQFSSTVESGYEALVLAKVMAEYVRIKGGIVAIDAPPAGSFINQGPGRFRIGKSFRIEFANGESFYFAADVEVFGLAALNQIRPVGILFEADVVVIPQAFAQDIINNYDGYPAPQHLDSVYECKFGQYSKGQLRELLGFRRHVSYLRGRSMNPANNNNPRHLFKFKVLNSNPPIAVKMARPKTRVFFDIDTASLYDLQELKIF
jgi:hypothetical protein